MNEQRYAVFFSDGGYQHNEDDQDEFSGVGLEEIIAFGAKRWPSCAPVAWAPEWPGGGLSTIQLREASVAAGRLIEKTASGWVALGAEKQEESDLPELVKNFQQRELRKGEPTSAPNKQHVERRLPPLDWNRPTPFDPFNGFVVTRGGYRGEQDVMLAPRHALQLSIDSCAGPSDHLNASRHQMAAHKG